VTVGLKDRLSRIEERLAVLDERTRVLWVVTRCEGAPPGYHGPLPYEVVEKEPGPCGGFGLITRYEGPYDDGEEDTAA